MVGHKTNEDAEDVLHAHLANEVGHWVALGGDVAGERGRARARNEWGGSLEQYEHTARQPTTSEK